MRMKILISPATSVLVLAVVIGWFSTAPARGGLDLARNGQSKYRIVISANAPPSERYAAAELQHYLQKISGATLRIVTDDQKPTAREILLGDNSHLRRMPFKCDFAALGPEGFRLGTRQRRLIIAGGKPRGTLYGVYALLEDHLGVRWFTPDLEVVPPTNHLLVPTLNETQVPALEYREVFWTEMLHDADFAARHRLNGDHYKLTDKHGGRAAVYFPFVHSLDSLIPRELYAEHPDYFPLINGKRVDGYVQRCLSNPEVVKLAIARVRQWIHEHPEATIISVSQNDTANWCQCPTCKALDDAEGTPAASLLRFVNAIAENIAKDYPNLRIDTLAYQYTRKPPKTLRPRPNVILRLCSIECCFAHPLATCTSEQNARFRQDILAWEPVAPKLYVWDYTPNFAHYQQPFPNFAALQPNVQFFVAHRVKGLFEQGNYSSGGHGEMEPLRAYLLAELLWNPNADVRKMTDEFLRAYYGSAAPELAKYLSLLEDQVSSPDVHAHIYDPPRARYLNDTFIQGAGALFAEAEQAAENDTVRFRVKLARLPIWYVQLATGRVTGEARATLLKQFLEIARKAGISNISEGQSLEAWAEGMQK
jgi:Domain of unknown function (DUF4838)/Glycosyl hydrolase family 67 N-terminus